MLDTKKTAVRAVSGAVYVLIIILACWAGDIGVAILAGVMAALGITELRKMRFADTSATGIGLYDVMGALCLVFCPIPAILFPYPFLLLWFIWLIGRMILTVYSRREHPEREFAVDIASQVYVALPLAMMVFMGIFLYMTEGTCMPILAMFILIWINDTGAYLFGSIFGRHRLFERISPKKSWEGFWGGLACSVALGAIFGATHSPLSALNVSHPVLFWALGGLIVAIFSTFGDLFESCIKRNLNMKDSGNLIPGHGGILDRIDSLLMVIPASILYYVIYRTITEILH